MAAAAGPPVPGGIQVHSGYNLNFNSEKNRKKAFKSKTLNYQQYHPNHDQHIVVRDRNDALWRYDNNDLNRKALYDHLNSLEYPENRYDEPPDTGTTPSMPPDVPSGHISNLDSKEDEGEEKTAFGGRPPGRVGPEGRGRARGGMF